MDLFKDQLVGTTGTLVFGNGIDADRVEVIGGGEDYIVAEVESRPHVPRRRIIVPLASIVYYRLA